jgi:GMP synthase (glutamine-hydrolysing)
MGARPLRSASTSPKGTRLTVPDATAGDAAVELGVAGGAVSDSELTSQEVLVLDFGGQYSQLIARRVRECGVYSELLPSNIPIEALKERQPDGIILS